MSKPTGTLPEGSNEPKCARRVHGGTWSVCGKGRDHFLHYPHISGHDCFSANHSADEHHVFVQPSAPNSEPTPERCARCGRSHKGQGGAYFGPACDCAAVAPSPLPTPGHSAGLREALTVLTRAARAVPGAPDSLDSIYALAVKLCRLTPGPCWCGAHVSTAMQTGPTIPLGEQTPIETDEEAFAAFMRGLSDLEPINHDTVALAFKFAIAHARRSAQPTAEAPTARCENCGSDQFRRWCNDCGVPSGRATVQGIAEEIVQDLADRIDAAIRIAIPRADLPLNRTHMREWTLAILAKHLTARTTKESV